MAKQAYSFTFLLEELLYDVENQSYLTARTLSDTGASPATADHAVAGDEQERRNQVLRSISTAVAALKVLLAEYLDEGCPSADNALMDGAKDVQITIKMPANFNSSVVQPLAEQMHRFIVETALTDWLLLTDKADADGHAAKAAACVSVISEALGERTRPTREEADGTDDTETTT